MQSFVATTLALCFALGEAGAGPPATTPASGVALPLAMRLGPSAPPSDDATIAEAQEAWRKGDYPKARRKLEPIAERIDSISDPLVREKVLTYLADATLNDPTLDADQRRESARGHLAKLMDADPQWQLPPDIYTRDLYSIYQQLREERNTKAGAQCLADKVACESDLTEAKSDMAREKTKYLVLEKKYSEQEVEVREQVARTRALALIPFGVGHFYNGQPALGGSFLAAELIFGGAGLGLLLQRTVGDGCRRTRGFQAGSLQCEEHGEQTQEELDRRRAGIERRRRAEEAMGWFFLGTILVDVLIAQILFEPVRTTNVRRIKRKELETEAASKPPRRARQRKQKPKVRAAPTFGRGGAGLAVHVRF